ncbi:MAG: RNA-binding protein hfq [Limnoraphis sp. WC205]|jgi:host factor-I protein|nr:RNA-binding protein hfq [Limnoraphis sp. WC205]
MSDFDTGLPSIRQVQTYTQDKQPVEIKLLTNDILVGTVFWQDHNCICLQDEHQKPILVWRQAIAYLKPKS